MSETTTTLPELSSTSASPTAGAPSRTLLHIEDLARLLRTNNAAIFRMVRRGKLPGRRVGRRDVVMTRTAFHAWLDAPVVEALSARRTASSSPSPAPAPETPSADPSPELPRPEVANVHSVSRPTRRHPRAREVEPLSTWVRRLERDERQRRA